ncbi:Type 1 glutamine amidotransferase-like domain-containing protein [Halobacillus sp. A5]|uniref:Type 1 glutamine amidotransferase-like domain-containing protein n=1 Tax=Halobacillus sp. A5 TaxID=2880263 RepID=UPI0020A67F02|nr:Type 1 glutamine amidotransferase-like domain-containing protein [Halobacillus sp. A5]MCP3027402.1 Type 1 glutamine amidotransferase-like domain-containing protein [Halobacillus sp. A5]
MGKHLFLMGGGPPMPGELAKIFAGLAGEGTVVLLYIPRKGMRIEEYSSVYTAPVSSQSTHVQFSFVSIKESYPSSELNQLRKADGIMIGGGDTVRYQQGIVQTEAASIIRDLYAKGVPVAGFSAGALIAPETCVISPKDTKEGGPLYKGGLGLVKDVVVAAHYLSWKEEDHLKQAVHKAGVDAGYGIADQSGIYLTEQGMTAVEGYVYVERSYSSFMQGKG